MAFTLRQLKYFVTAAELGQISQAGVQLNISQSAITTAVRDLEAFLGNSLFDRVASGVVLTPMGRRFLSHAYEVLDAAERATSMPHEESVIGGKIKLAVTSTVAGYFLPTHWLRLGQLHPNLHIEVQEYNRPDVETALARGEADMALLLTDNLQRPEVLHCENFVSSPRRVWVGSNHELLQSGGSIAMSDVAKYPVVMWSSDEAEQTTSRCWRQSGLEPKILMRTHSIEAVRSLVASGLGVSVQPDLVHRPWSMEGRRIETIPVKEDIPSMNVGLCWGKSANLSEAAQAFREYFRHYFFATPSLGQGGVGGGGQ